MKKFVKLPLYFGLFIFVAAILLSAIKVGEKGSITNQKSKASSAGASLSLKYTPPNLVSVLVNSEKEIAGVDAVIKFDKENISVLPSTLRGTTAFTTTGGKVDEKNGTFSFTALVKTKTASGIIASFDIKTLGKPSGELSFVTGSEGSAVIEAATKENILTSTVGVNLSQPSK